MSLIKPQIEVEDEACIPHYAHYNDAGCDLVFWDKDVMSEPVVIMPGDRYLASTGIKIALPDGYVGLVHPRSGIALRHGMTVTNAPGTIDAGYRGTVKVILQNLGVSPYNLWRGDRIAQLVIQEHVRAEWQIVDSLEESDRGEGGFGSTGD